MQKGSELEKIAEKQNIEDKLNGTAVILKVPVPIILTSKGLQPMQSTVDFVGIVDGGKFIAFDAKETNITTRFPLNNIHGHQLEYLKMVRNLKGIAFFLIWFKKVNLDTAFVVPISLIEEFWDSENHSSIPYKTLAERSIHVPLKDYLIFLKDDNAISKLLR